MRTYKTVEENDDQEKIIGGYITIGQAGILAGGLVVGLGLGSVGYKLVGNLIMFVVLALPPLVVALILAFVRIHDMSIFEYFRVKREFDQQEQYLPNCRPQYIEEVDDPNAADMDEIYNEESIMSDVDEGNGFIKDVLVKKNLKQKERKELGLTNDDTDVDTASMRDKMKHLSFKQ